MSNAWFEADRLFKELIEQDKLSKELKRIHEEFAQRKLIRQSEERARRIEMWIYIGLMIACLCGIFLPGLIQNLAR